MLSDTVSYCPACTWPVPKPPGQSLMVSFKASQMARDPQLTAPVAANKNIVIQSFRRYCTRQHHTIPHSFFVRNVNNQNHRNMKVDERHEELLKFSHPILSRNRSKNNGQTAFKSVALESGLGRLNTLPHPSLEPLCFDSLSRSPRKSQEAPGSTHPCRPCMTHDPSLPQRAIRWELMTRPAATEFV